MSPNKKKGDSIIITRGNVFFTKPFVGSNNCERILKE